MNAASRSIAAALQRVVDDAHKRGVFLVADAGDPPAIRVLTRAERKLEDIRQAGIAVEVDDSCAGPYARVSGDVCNFGVS